MSRKKSIMSKLRCNKGLSQKELADKLGVRRATISDWETGKFIPSEEYVPLLAQVLGVSEFEIRRYIGEKMRENEEKTLKKQLKETTKALLQYGVCKESILRLIKDCF